MKKKHSGIQIWNHRIGSLELYSLSNGGNFHTLRISVSFPPTVKKVVDECLSIIVNFLLYTFNKCKR